jgi:hypothetical protein
MQTYFLAICKFHYELLAAYFSFFYSSTSMPIQSLSQIEEFQQRIEALEIKNNYLKVQIEHLKEILS